MFGNGENQMINEEKIIKLFNEGKIEEARKLSDKVDWCFISRDQTLSEDFIREFKNKVNWMSISRNQKLTEDFIREFKDKVYWLYVLEYQTLSEAFIREFQNKVNWLYVLEYQTLSEAFIREFQNEVDWIEISINQTLLENFIREFEDKVDWRWVSIYQTLSEDFIREFQNKVDWFYISKDQTLSEDFIREFQDKVNWDRISKYQTLSEDFIKEFNLHIPETCWIYKSNEFKLKKLKELNLYEVIDDKYVIAYKSVKFNYESVFKRNFFYKIGETFEAHCDCDETNENSFGLSAWTKNGALRYYSKGKLLKVQIPIEDLGVIVHNGNKLRCRKLKVIEEV